MGERMAAATAMILAQVDAMSDAGPSDGQLMLLVASIVLFTAGGVLSLLRLRRDSAAMAAGNPAPRTEKLRIAAKACMWGGVTLLVALLIWHSIDRDNWLPLGDNFDALVWLGVLLSLFVLYVQRRRPLGGLDWFVMPIVILMLLGAAVFGRTKPHEYVDDTWAWVHSLTAFGSTLAFSIAGVIALMYLINLRRIRSKSALTGPTIGGSLERLEHLMTNSVTLGFALLTIGMIMGVAEMKRGGRASVLKIVLACSAWVVYAIALHAPLNPSFRGRRVAVLNLLGFALTVSTLIVVMLMPQHAGGAH